MDNYKLEKVEVGEKLDWLGIKPCTKTREINPFIVAVGPAVFLIVLQGDWTRKELRNTDNRLTIDITEIDDVLDFVFTIQDCVNFDMTYNVYNTAPEIEFVEVEEDKGVAFHLVFMDCDTYVLKQRLVSLNTEPSNDLIHTLQDIKSKNFTKEQYNQKITQFLQNISFEEAKRNSFIHQNFYRNR